MSLLRMAWVTLGPASHGGVPCTPNNTAQKQTSQSHNGVASQQVLGGSLVYWLASLVASTKLINIGPG